MVSKNTKRKRRINRVVLKARCQVQLKLIDRRLDYWLISKPDPQPGLPVWWTFHKEVRGRKEALRYASNQVQSIKA